MKTVLITLLGGIFLVNAFVYAQDNLELEKITVRRKAAPGSFSSKEIISAKELQEKNLNSLPEVLNLVSGLDLRQRGAFGIQADTSLRGSSFEQVAILIDGIRVMDPQTGHYNLDIPLTMFDIERVEIIKSGASSNYGAGALAGSINFVTKKPGSRSFNMEALGGDYALGGQSFSLSMPMNRFSGRISFDHKKAKAARPNTDFEYENGSFYLNKDFESASLDTLIGWQKKDYGADSFYSNLFPEEEEHTETLFLKSGFNKKIGVFDLRNDIFLRRHDDKFILKRNSPTSVNYHTTYVYGLGSSLFVPVQSGSLLFGASAGRDEINSTNLGKHARLYEAAMLTHSFLWQDKLSSDFGLRADHYQKWSWQESFNLDLAYKILEDKLRIHGGICSAFRVPTFTELFYNDAANRGNPELGIERSYSATCGLNLKKDFYSFGLEGFYRRGENLIDWTRLSTLAPWQATNLGQVDYKGVTFNSVVRPGIDSRAFKLSQASFSYNYTDADKKASGFYSKYALDILMHQFVLGLNCQVFGIDLDWQFSYNKRYYSETYFTGNIYIGRKFAGKELNFEPFIKIDNFTNSEYSENTGVLQPGRWMQAGVKLEW